MYFIRLLRSCLVLLFLSPAGTSGIHLFAYPSDNITASNQQNTIQNVSGRIIDSNGEPVIGATVKVDQTSLGTITDVDGLFSIKASKGQKLTISCIGYDTKQIGIDNDHLEITLDDHNSQLDDLVVIGYGKVKKVSLTGSVSSVSGKDLLAAPMQSVSNLLAGKFSGLTTIQTNGVPGEDDASILVRGGMSGFGAQSPLVLVNPNDIESVSVLKDAAAAIYGIHGSNGVILITTKKGQGKPQINYSGSVSAINNTAFPEYLDAAEFMYYKNKALMMDGFDPLYSAEIQQKVLSNDPDSPWGETDWFDEIFRTAFMQQHNLSASGSTDRINYYASLGYMSQEGTVKHTDYSRINARTNLDIKVAKNLDFAVTMSGIKTNRNAPAEDLFYKQSAINPIRQASNTAPVIKKEWNGYTLAWKEGEEINVNPVAALEKSGYAKLDNWIFNSTFKLEYDLSDLWEPLKGLNISAFFAYDYNHGESRTFTQGYKLLAFNNNTLEAREETSYGIGMEKALKRISDNYWTWQFRPALSYNRKFGSHDISFLAFYEKSRNYNDMLAAWAKGYISDYPVDITIAPNRKDGVELPQGHFQYTGMASYAFRLSYGYDEKYLVDLAMRRDGSYVFAPENRWGTFPSLSGAWVMSRENFMSDINWLDLLKIRLSYGETGSDDVTPFLYNTTYSKATNSFVLGDALYSQYYANPVYTFRGLTWAHTKTYNLGLDFSLFHSRLTGEIDVFYKKTTDILESSSGSYPLSLGGFYPSVSNTGAVDNRGFEITLTHQNTVNRDFSYRVRGSFSFARNKLLRAKVSDNYPNHRGIFGKPLGARIGFKTLGLFQTQEEIDTYPVPPSPCDLKPGDIIYMDVNGDGKIEWKDDYVVIGYGQLPEINFSFNIDLNYKNFYLTSVWQGVSHCDYMLQGEYDSGVIAPTVYGQPFMTGNSPKYLIEQAWTPENRDAKFPRLSTVYNPNNDQLSDWWLVNGEYLRLKNLQIGYNFPQKWLKNTPFSMINIYLAGTNLLTFSHFKYIDPESPSVSNGYYPQQKTYTLGLNVSF